MTRNSISSWQLQSDLAAHRSYAQPLASAMRSGFAGVEQSPKMKGGEEVMRIEDRGSEKPGKERGLAKREVVWYC